MSTAKLDKNKLINFNDKITFYDQNNVEIETNADGKSITEISDIPIHTLNAFVSIEDKRFYNHKGVDTRGFYRAMLNNITSFSFKEGASTISQQLIKNTHLTNEKTFNRKLKEIKLAKELEKNYTKNEILEMYLNTIYFGNGCYGITNASKQFFNKTPDKLSINESAILAASIKAPAIYSPLNNVEKSNQRKNLVLNEMYSQKYISKEQLDENLSINVEDELFCEEITSNKFNFISEAKKEVDRILNNNLIFNENLKVYTYCDNEIQKYIQNEINQDNLQCDKTAIVMGKNNEVYAYFSTCKDYNRQIGSTIKPLLVYAPAIESGNVYSCSKIYDEKVDFNGYSPSNYNDKYYGNVSVKFSLAKSLNTCAVKLLNQVGIEKCKSYLSTTDLTFTENDNNLAIALGSTEKGESLINLTSAYGVFNNKGYYVRPKYIKEIVNEKGKVIYKDSTIKKKVFNEGTCNVINDMLRYTVTDGTAKKLSFLPYEICSKTGTVGFNNGNTDAYSISYSNDYTIGIRYFNKDNSLMQNNISGGTYPTIFAGKLWNSIYKNKTPTKFDLLSKCVKLNIDKLSYDKEGKVLLAEEIAPKKYVIEEIFTEENVPKTKSTFFSSPTINNCELSVNNSDILINLCQTEYYNYKIYRRCNNKKIEIYDTKGKKFNNVFIDKDIIENQIYEYYILPYYCYNDKTYFGKEYYVGKIKSPIKNIGDWWNDDFD